MRKVDPVDAAVPVYREMRALFIIIFVLESSYATSGPPSPSCCDVDECLEEGYSY